MMTCGIDVGARTTKAVVLDGKRAAGDAILDTGSDAAATARRVFEAALAAAGVEEPDLTCVVATGYGRGTVAWADRTVTEITCQARGARQMVPEAAGVLDVGGQDAKAIALESDGTVRDFVMNDRCAAGTGRFLEVMAAAFGVDLAEASRLALAAPSPVAIASTCTVFAESEVVSLRAQGRRSEDILAGVYASAALRLRAMAERIALKPPVVFTGGVAKQGAAVKAVRKVMGFRVVVPDRPQTTGALGAALIAREARAAG